ncbi:hypothetical protein [Echinimonas agarilytica]|uniref:Lipoprotein n=1 Tax=Echinimonas agarilytica TaxID=1215918 RepID=A0AA42B5X3_9GAMM|nr:hypothetical protein [Echinimonas agarilytica]MCM2678172.1 hypothetical protein [Echinimonas agarilytica]
MKGITNILVSTALIMFIGGCTVGHEDFIRYLNMNIGESIEIQELTRSSNAGNLIRADYLIDGEGLTNITVLDNGVVRYHFSIQEILSNYSAKDEVGKCLIYYDVDPHTNIIIAWGFDKGGNPLSCRTFI